MQIENTNLSQFIAKYAQFAGGYQFARLSDIIDVFSRLAIGRQSPLHNIQAKTGTGQSRATGGTQDKVTGLIVPRQEAH